MRKILFIILVFCCTNSFANDLQKLEVGKRQGGFINTFYQLVTKTSDHNKNFLFSPVSVKLSLGMLMNGANDKTKKEFQHALNYEGLSLDDINSNNHQFMMRTNDSSSVNKMLIANSLWINSCKKANVRKKYIDLMLGSYMSDVQKRNFCKDLALVENEMRQWVTDRTNGFLNYSPEVKAEDAMVGINTVYFKGLWDEPPITPSQPQPFYNRNGSTVDCIYLKYSKKSMPYFGNRYFRAVKLFYKNADYSMIVVLPQRNLENTEAETLAKATSDSVLGQKPQIFENKDLSTTNYQLKRNTLESQFSIAEKLKRNKEMRFFQDYRQNSDNVVAESPLYKSPLPNRTYRKELKDFMDVDSIISHIEWEKMYFTDITFDEVRVPHFETENSIDLKPILADMGVPSVFDPDANSLSKIADSLYVSNYTQKAKIIVNEKGTEVAAATYWSLNLLSSSSVKREPVTFIADRPFLYAICDERTGTILFVGRVVDLGK